MTHPISANSTAVAISATLLLALCLALGHSQYHQVSCATLSMSQQPLSQAIQGQKQPSGAELAGKLLQLTKSSISDESTDGDDLKVTSIGLSKKYQLSKKAHKSVGEEQKMKLALKEKWHQLVDELIDDTATGAGDKFAVNKPVARKRQLVIESQADDQQFAGELGDKLMIVVKRKPTTFDEFSAQSQLNALDKELSQQPQPQQQQQQQQQGIAPQPQMDMTQHQRRILDDVAGIRRDSVFTTNNHLGIKGVPKFGYDEQF